MLTFLDRRAAFILVLLSFFALLPLIAMAFDADFYISQFRRILIFAIVAISLDLILGYGGMVSLGHAAFFGIGAYVVAILNWHAQEETALLGFIPGSRNILVTWPAAVLVSATAALAVGAISLRTSGIYFIMITLAFAQMIYFFFVSLEAYGGDDGLRFPGDIGFIDAATNALADAGYDPARSFDTLFYYFTFAVFLLVLYGSYRLVNSRFGMVIRGCHENERRMRAIGFATFRYKLVCFTIAGSVAGLAGALFAAHESYISPSIMHWTRSGDLIIMIVLGGIGTLIGPVAGATLFLLLEKFLPDYTQHWPIVFGPILILVVLFAKNGIYGSLLPRQARHEH
jgi:branched-chain amino acid transport system permease protein